jgi:transposase
VTHVLTFPLAAWSGDTGVIDMALLSVIRRWHFREEMPIREIERRTSLSRNTIRKYLRAGTIEPRFKVPDRPSKLDPFAEKLSGWLRNEVAKSRKQRRTAKQMHADLVVLGYDGSYGRVAAFVRAWKAERQREQQTNGRGTFVRLVFAAGEAFQFDWSEDWAMLGGRQTKLQVAHTKLSHSRAFAVRAYLLQTHEMLFDALTQAFRLLGGVPRRGIFDNMRTAVDRIGAGTRYSVPASFANRPVSLRIYPDRIVIAAEGQILCEDKRIIERSHHLPGRTVYDWHHYLAVIQRKPGALRNGAPFAEMPEAFQQSQRYLLKHPGGDREMVEILALVLQHDEQAVLCAVELALEAGVPTKTHIINILQRLTDGHTLNTVSTDASGNPIALPQGLTINSPLAAGPGTDRDGNPAPPNNYAGLGVPGIPLDATLKQHNVSWRVGLDYKPAEQLLLYANVSRGYKAGSFTTLAVANYITALPVSQEYVTAYEAGIKAGLFDHRVQFNAAGFYMDYRNKQVRGKLFDFVFGTQDVLVNVPKSRIWGAEADITVRPVKDLTITGAVTYLNSKVLKFVGYDIFGGVNNPNFDPTGAHPNTEDLSGNVLPYTPKWSGTVNVDYKFEMANGGKPFAGFTVNAKSGQDAAIGGSHTTLPVMPGNRYRIAPGVGPYPYTIDGYATVDARLGYVSPDENWRVMI